MKQFLIITTIKLILSKKLAFCKQQIDESFKNTVTKIITENFWYIPFGFLSILKTCGVDLAEKLVESDPTEFTAWHS